MFIVDRHALFVSRCVLLRCEFCVVSFAFFALFSCVCFVCFVVCVVLRYFALFCVVLHCFALFVCVVGLRCLFVCLPPSRVGSEFVSARGCDVYLPAHVA